MFGETCKACADSAHSAKASADAVHSCSHRACAVNQGRRRRPWRGAFLLPLGGHAHTRTHMSWTHWKKKLVLKGSTDPTVEGKTIYCRIENERIWSMCPWEWPGCASSAAPFLVRIREVKDCELLFFFPRDTRLFSCVTVSALHTGRYAI
jgi:hypothetical protein